MTTAARLAALLLVSAALAPAGSRADDCAAGKPADITSDQLNTLVKEIDALARRRALGRHESPEHRKAYQALCQKLSELKYDQDTVHVLSGQLNRTGKQLERLCVVSLLLRPLLASDEKTIRAALPAINNAHRRLGRYLPLPRYSHAALKACRIPAYRRSVTAEAMLRTIEIVGRKQRQKIAKEELVDARNKRVCEFEKTVYALKVKANDPNEDQQLLKMIVQLQKKGLATYILIVNAIQEQAANMKQDRAERFYTGLKKIAARFQQQKKQYLLPSAAVIRRSENSSFESILDYPGVRICYALSQLAKPAKKPDVRIPKLKDTRWRPNAMKPG